MNEIGINQGTSGNVSARVPGGFLITPSGIPYDTLAPEQVRINCTIKKMKCKKKVDAYRLSTQWCMVQWTKSTIQYRRTAVQEQLNLLLN